MDTSLICNENRTLSATGRRRAYVVLLSAERIAWLCERTMVSNPLLAEFRAVWGIHVQESDCRPTRWSDADDVRPMKHKVVKPWMFSWVIEWHDLFRIGIHAGEIRTFVSVTSIARQAKRVRIIGNISDMLFSDDVINVEREQWTCLLRQQTVFAAIGCPLAHCVAGRFIHVGLD